MKCSLMNISATFTVTQWNEDTIHELRSDQKMTRSMVEYLLVGDMEGGIQAEYLMYYSRVDVKDPHQSTAHYIGLLYFEGALSGKRGSVLFEERGTFDRGAAQSVLKIIEGSGTEELLGIGGSGGYRADQKGNRIELDYLFR